MRPFAKLDTGDVVFGPAPGMGLGVPRDDLADMDFSAFSAFVAEQVAMRPPAHLAAAHGHGCMERWEQLSDLLRQSGVAARADDLITMPFEMIVDAEVRRLLREA